MERKKLNKLTNGACRGCARCNGYGCIGEVPGMGGKGFAKTFINNYKSWEDIEVRGTELPEIGVAPMTGVEQNMGNPFPEAEFHNYIVKGAKKAGIFSCIGDGTPDFKLLDGADALRKNGVKGSVFIKPYPNKNIIERYNWIEDVSDIVGIDIDSYHIPTMDGLVPLEKKSSSQLKELKKIFEKRFAVKGIQSMDDLELVRDLKPDIVVISNHGGRVFDNGRGIAYSLQELAGQVKNYCNEIWVDGGLRSINHMKKAKALGASRVLIGRPFIQATILLKSEGISNWLNSLK